MAGARAGVIKPYHHMHDMVCHMKTTLNIDEPVMVAVKREAARRGITMTALVEEALRKELRTASAPSRGLDPLPTFDSGGAVVDVADRDALYAAMEGR